MKKSTVKNLVIGAVALLGISYIAESYIKNRKRETEYKLSKECLELEEMKKLNSGEKSYVTLAETNLNSNEKVKKVI